MSNVEMLPKRQMSGFAKFLIVMAIVIPVIIVLQVVNANSRDTGPAPEQLLIEAEWACEGVVESNLKAPSTAEYDSSASGSGPWNVIGTVDAENSFGAKIRSTYSCTVERSGDTMTATLQSLSGP